MSYTRRLRDVGRDGRRRRAPARATATTVRVRDGERSSPTGRSPRRRRSSAATTSSTSPTSTPRSAWAAQIAEHRLRHRRGPPGHGVRPGERDRPRRARPPSRGPPARSARPVARDARPPRRRRLRPRRGRAAGRARRRAVTTWPRDGVPRNAGGLAHHRRRGGARSTACAASARWPTRERDGSPDRRGAGAPTRPSPSRTTPARRRPAAPHLHLLPPGARAEARVALTLRTLGGLTTARDRPRVPRRPSRRWRSGSCGPSARSPRRGIPYRVPARRRAARAARAACSPSSTSSSTRATPRRPATRSCAPDLCAEAIRLAPPARRAACPTSPRSLGLLALMLLHDARRGARVDADGALVAARRPGPLPLGPRRDRRGPRGLLERALRAAARPARTSCRPRSPRCTPRRRRGRRPTGRRSPRSTARSPGSRRRPSSTLNRAVAVGVRRRAAGAAWPLLERAARRRARSHAYQPLHAARAELLRRAGDPAGAGAAYGRAIALTRQRRRARRARTATRRRRRARAAAPLTSPPAGTGETGRGGRDAPRPT